MTTLERDVQAAQTLPLAAGWAADSGSVIPTVSDSDLVDLAFPGEETTVTGG